MRRRGRPGLLGTVGRTAVVAGTATANAVNRHAQNKAAEKEQAAANEAQQAAPPPPPPPPAPVAPASAPAPAPAPGDDLVSKLTELAKLRDSGVLSQEEFEQAKALVLNP
jgi:Short C-terminal domain